MEFTFESFMPVPGGNKFVQETGNYGILAAEQSAGKGADEEGERRLPDESKGIQLHCTKTDGKRN